MWYMVFKSVGKILYPFDMVHDSIQFRIGGIISPSFVKALSRSYVYWNEITFLSKDKQKTDRDFIQLALYICIYIFRMQWNNLIHAQCVS